VLKVANLTLSIDDRLLARSRALARERGYSLNGYIRHHLQAVAGEPGPNEEWLAETMRVSAENGFGSGGRKWTREELHERGSGEEG
jgi:hypothetical protein